MSKAHLHVVGLHRELLGWRKAVQVAWLTCLQMNSEATEEGLKPDYLIPLGLVFGITAITATQLANEPV